MRLLNKRILKIVALRHFKLVSARNVVEKKRRKTYPRHNYKESVWWHFLSKPTIQDDNHRDGKLFRRRFRVPYELYRQLLHQCREGALKNYFNNRAHDAVGRPGVPLELKLLGVLRVLGRASCFDSIAELTGTDDEVHRSFFHKFLDAFVTELFGVYVTTPRSEEGVSKVMNAYDALGFTGCIGSVDCVHIPWGRCPAGKSNLYIGKEGYPTIAYQVVCDHTLRIMSATSGHYGTRNDKTIVKFDSFVNALRKKEIFGDVKYTLRSKGDDGTLSTIDVVGPYLICDGGYHKWRILQEPLKHATSYAQIRWSKWLESVRKDIERVFGIMKRRFLILNHSMEYNTQTKCDNVFLACCMLHNMLHAYDGYDVRWEEELENECDDPEEAEVVIRWRARVEQQVNAIDRTRVGRNYFARNQVISFVYDQVDCVVETEETNIQLKMLLVNHFAIRFADNAIRWLN